ncbi:MAG: hypothetical protein ISR44_01490 [Rhodospirillales bacterium]|nr:hypothetical protein [Rhodospirillales bacterium]
MLALVFLITLLATQPTLARDYSKTPCEEDLGEVLELSVSMFDTHRGAHPGQANFTARSMGVEYALCIDELISLARQYDMSRRSFAKKDFIAELEWVRNLFNREMSEIYRQAKIYESIAGEGNASTRASASIIGTRLHLWAMKHKYPPAEFDSIQRYSKRNGGLSERRLAELAIQKYVPAIVDLARRKFSGDGLERNLGEAWYWLKRAQQENVDTSSITKKSLNRLLEEMDEKERRTLKVFSHVYGELDLTNIDIPATFAPLSATLPDPLSDEEVKTFAKKFEGLSRISEVETLRIVDGQLLDRTTGIHHSGIVNSNFLFRPFGMSHNEFMLRKCNYNRAMGRIFPQGRNEKWRQLDRKSNALVSLFEKDAARYISDAIQCGRLFPNPKSKAMSDALAWAKKLDQMDLAALRTLAEKHLEKSGSSSKTEFKPVPKLDREIQRELFMHYHLANTIQRFAEFKHPDK